MRFTFTIDCQTDDVEHYEEDGGGIRSRTMEDAITTIETILSYMMDNVVVTSNLCHDL